jgi:hypothetical protein
MWLETESAKVLAMPIQQWTFVALIVALMDRREAGAAGLVLTPLCIPSAREHQVLMLNFPIFIAFESGRTSHCVCFFKRLEVSPVGSVADECGMLSLPCLGAWLLENGDGTKINISSCARLPSNERLR